MGFIYVFLLLMLLKSTASVPQDLSGKMFTFPKQTASAHVKITTANQNLGALTVCLRFFTDITRECTLFSLANPTEANSFLIMKRQSDIDIYVNDVKVIFHGHDVKLNAWHSLCATWKAGTGLTQLWLNGNPSSRKSSTTPNLTGEFTIILGQEQDSVGGGFDENQSFVGMMADLHMWNYVLSSEQIKNYSENLPFANGNILNWGSMEFVTSGQVFAEDNQKLQ